MTLDTAGGDVSGEGEGRPMEDSATPVSAKGSPLYRLQGVERRYMKGEAEVAALRGVTLDVTAGEFVCIEGPSGSGKSTLLQLLGALDTPTSGTVQMEGQELATAGDRVLTGIRSKRIGFVFQQFNLIPTLSASENVALAMAPGDGSARSGLQRLAIAGAGRSVSGKDAGAAKAIHSCAENEN